MKHFYLLTVTALIGLVTLGFSLVSCVNAQDSLGQRIREMQKRKNEDPQNYISNVPRTVQRSLEFEKLKRTFLVHTPPKYDGKTALPVVLCFHGGIGTGNSVDNFK